MTLSEIRAHAIAPALKLLPANMAAPEAEIIMLAIGLQESRLTFQRQIGGPAVGLWQFELGGGVKGVLNHRSSRHWALKVCAARGVQPLAEAVYEALAGTDDVLDAAFARLLLWTDPFPLPGYADVNAGFEYYLRTWRPGAYTRGTAEERNQLRAKWAIHWAQAVREVRR